MIKMRLNRDYDSRYFSLSNFYASVFLLAKNQILVNIDKQTDPKRARFVFQNSSELETLLQKYNYASENSPEIMIDPRRFVIALKSLKEKLF